MNDRCLRIAAGSMLHDFGKLLRGPDSGEDHCAAGYEYLKGNSRLSDYEDVLECVKYHHGNLLEGADVSGDAICYLTYIADNIASVYGGAEESSSGGGFVKGVPSESIFNILNGNDEKAVYSHRALSGEKGINYPEDRPGAGDGAFFEKAADNITDSLKDFAVTDEYVNSLLRLLEDNLTYVPSAAGEGGSRDISMYDHVKLTAAFAVCTEKYLAENNISDYCDELFRNADKFYDKKAFCVYSIDISGIQQFIYNISSKGALKGLRARSFYLEILMENAVDELLDRLGLCRANTLYTGGGHTYLIIPATESAVNTVNDFESELNSWLMETYGNALFAAGGYAYCSANDLRNRTEGSYKNIFRTVSETISAKKLRRYSAEDIIAMNSAAPAGSMRECSVCHRSDMLTDENKCAVCGGLEELANDIIGKDSYFAVMRRDIDPASVPLPFGCVMTAFSETRMQSAAGEAGYVRAYSKNKGYSGVNTVSDLWVGDYAAERDFARLAENAGGIKRIAVIRADVDNMGQAFVSGFEKTGGGKFETISRTAALSRKLSLYFKLHINYILENGEFQLFKDKSPRKRNAVIVYSGGDDLFIVGGWDDIICFSIDLYLSFAKYTRGTLTFSAGIGIYPPKYPIAAMAEQTGELEEYSKSYLGGKKNAVTLFDGTGTYSWDELIDNVIGEKLRVLQDFLDYSSDRGNSVLYRMLELIRGRNENNKLNIARFAYLIARLRPEGDDVTEEMTEKYNLFSQSVYRWIRDEEECRRLVTAIFIYVYMHRESEE